MKKNVWKFRIWSLTVLVLGLCAAISFTVFGPQKNVFSFHVYYREYVPGTTSRIFWAQDGNFTEEKSTAQILEEDRELWMNIKLQPEKLKDFQWIASDHTQSYAIAQVSFAVDKESCGDLRAGEMAEMFEPINAEIEVSEELDALLIHPQGENSGLLLKDTAVLDAVVNKAEEMDAVREKDRITGLLLLFLIGVFCVWKWDRIEAVMTELSARDAYGKKDVFTVLYTVILAAGLAGVCMIGLFSALGLHPDEWDVKACLDYGMTHWFPPDMRDPEVANTYSGYGYTKLDNTTWYFFLAGKIAWVCDALFERLAYYRIPNLLMFAAMCLITLRQLKKKNWLLLCTGISAQLWYIFSYTTADALDYFAAYLVILQITDKESMLFRLLGLPAEDSGRRLNLRNLCRYLYLGILFGFVFLGKPYYWSVLGLAFMVLLEKLVENRKDKVYFKQLFGRYMVILAVFVLFAAFRYSFDLLHYGMDKTSVEHEMDILYAHYDKNPLTPKEDWCVTYHMKENGFSLMDMFRQVPDWFGATYRSFCGFINDTNTDFWYFAAMGIIYIFIYLYLLWETFRRKTTLWDKWMFVIGSGLMAAALAASICNSWMIDVQPQGRYLLPVLLVAGFLAGRIPEAVKGRGFRAALAAGGILTAGYFILVGFPLFLTRIDLPF